MRIVPLLIVMSALAAAEPLPQPYPDGPLLTVSIPDAVRLRTHVTASWYGMLWASPAAEPLRRRMMELTSEAEALTGIAWSAAVTGSTRIDLVTGGRTALRLTSATAVAPLLAGVDAAIAADGQRVRAAQVALKAWMLRADRRPFGVRDDKDQTPELMPWVPVVRDQSGIVIAQPRSVWGQHRHDDDRGWRVLDEAQALTLSHPADVPAKLPDHLPGAAGHDLAFALDVAAYADATGIPGLGQALRLAGVSQAAGVIDLAGGRSSETVTIAGARLSLRRVDTTVLEAEVPAQALALTAVGIDGKALAGICARVAAEEPGLAPLDGPLLDVLEGIDGTAWLAVVPGTPLPDLVLAVPANVAVDVWLAHRFGDAATVFDVARRQVVTLDSQPGLPTTLALRRTPRAWLIATDAAVLERLGNPGLAKRLAGEHAIPATALALSVQANQPILQRLGVYALAAQVWLATQTAKEDVPPRIRTGGEREEPTFTRRQLGDLRLLAKALPGIVGGAQAPTTVGYLMADDRGATIHGRDLLAGLAVAPLGIATYVELLPVLLPGWTAGHHHLVASIWKVSSFLWVDSEPVGAGWGRLVGGFPDATAQIRALALRAPDPGVRGQALLLLAGTGSDDGMPATGLDWWQRGLADSRSAARAGALQGLGRILDRPGALLLVTGAFAHADPLTRAGAYRVIAERARTYRQAKRYQRSVPVILPAVVDALLAADAADHDPQALAALMPALAGYDDPRTVAALVRRVADPSPVVAVAALEALGETPAIAMHQDAALAAVRRLRDDQTRSGEYGWTIGNRARGVLHAHLTGADAEALIASDLDLPDPPVTSVSVYDVTPRQRALSVLIQRGNAAALARVEAELARTADDTTYFWVLVSALGQCPVAAVAEPLLVRLLVDPALPQGRRFQVTAGITARANKGALAAETIAALTATCLSDVAHARRMARQTLDRQKLTPEQAQAFTAAIQQAMKQFGDQAFPGYRPPKPPEPPPPPPVKAGADDF